MFIIRKSLQKLLVLLPFSVVLILLIQHLYDVNVLKSIMSIFENIPEKYRSLILNSLPLLILLYIFKKYNSLKKPFDIRKNIDAQDNPINYLSNLIKGLKMELDLIKVRLNLLTHFSPFPIVMLVIGHTMENNFPIELNNYLVVTFIIVILYFLKILSEYRNYKEILLDIKRFEQSLLTKEKELSDSKIYRQISSNRSVHADKSSYLK